MRDEAPVATFSPLVPDIKMIEVCVKASQQTTRARRELSGSNDDDEDVNNDSNNCPTLVFTNDMAGNEAAKQFCEERLSLFFHKDLNRLADMVCFVPDFPSQGIRFLDILGVAQKPGGLALSVLLLQIQFTGNWANIDVIACCETGGLIFASALAPRVDVPLALIRQAGKLPPSTISTVKSASYISSPGSEGSMEKNMIEIGKNVIPRGASVVVVDDVLASGNTLLTVLQLLGEAGVDAKDVHVLVVAEFPVHGGRELLRKEDFGGVNVQSLLVFGGN